MKKVFLQKKKCLSSKSVRRASEKGGTCVDLGIPRSPGFKFQTRPNGQRGQRGLGDGPRRPIESKGGEGY